MSYQQRIYAQALRDGMPDNFARLMVDWASLETAYNGIPFNSNVFLHCNNAYGYKWIGQSTANGPCLLSPEGDYYAGYGSIEQSVHEVCLWVYRRINEGSFPADLRTVASPYQFAALLKNTGYYGDTLANYANNLTYWHSQNSNLSFGAKTAGVGLLLLVGLGLAYHYRASLRNSKTFSIFV